MKHVIRYNHALRVLARRLRNHSTLTELMLWKELKGKKLRGYEFHRQKPIDKYIVDFYCPRLHLAIEVGDEIHYAHQAKDRLRQKKIEAVGVHILQFTNVEVKETIKDVVQTIEKWIDNFEYNN